jgi:hypothetical protein
MQLLNLNFAAEFTGCRQHEKYSYTVKTHSFETVIGNFAVFQILV